MTEYTLCNPHNVDAGLSSILSGNGGLTGLRIQHIRSVSASEDIGRISGDGAKYAGDEMVGGTRFEATITLVRKLEYI